MKYFIVIILALWSAGCGPENNSYNPNPEINVEHNLTKSINYLKREFAEAYITTYVAENKKDLFVYAKSKEANYYDTDYSLYHYTRAYSVKPKLVNTIVDQNSVEIKGIDFLPENKIMYVRTNYKGNEAFVCVYDYQQQREIKRSEGYWLYIFKVELSKDKCFVTLYDDRESVRIDIGDIYKNYDCNTF